MNKIIQPHSKYEHIVNKILIYNILKPTDRKEGVYLLLKILRKKI
jgi:hypothetical protein